MLQLELTDEDQQILAELLEERIGELRLEVADTDRAEYREMLKKRERALKKLLALVRPAAP